LVLPLLGVIILCEACLLTLTVLLRVENSDQTTQDLLFCGVSFASTLVVFLLSVYRIRMILLALVHNAVTPAARRSRGRSLFIPSWSSVAALGTGENMATTPANTTASDSKVVQEAMDV
jgi:hypothetical protein